MERIKLSLNIVALNNIFQITFDFEAWSYYMISAFRIISNKNHVNFSIGALSFP